MTWIIAYLCVAIGATISFAQHVRRLPEADKQDVPAALSAIMVLLLGALWPLSIVFGILIVFGEWLKGGRA